MRYTIHKVKMPYTLPGFYRGYGWELRDNQEKKIIDVYPVKDVADTQKRILKNQSDPSVVTDLIKFTNSHDRLQKIRDEIYSTRLTNKHGKEMNLKFINPLSFKALLSESVYEFRKRHAYKEFWRFEHMSNTQRKDYCQWYADQFTVWKSDRNVVSNNCP